MNATTFLQRFPMALLAVSLAWFGCNGTSTPNVAAGTVAGTIAGLEAGTEVVLRSFENGNLVNVASATLDSAGGFTLVPESPLKSGYHQLLAGRKHPLVLITNSSEGVHIAAEAREGENYMVNASISGSPNR